MESALMSMIFELKPNTHHAAKLCRGFLRFFAFFGFSERSLDAM